MIPWSKYPYLDLHDLNLDWILEVIKQLDGEMDEFKALNKITFDGEWDITKQYPAWCIVNTNGGTQGYISIKPVPAGVVITNTDYWAGVVDYTATIADLQNRVVALENGLSSLTNEVDLMKLENKSIIFVADSYGESPSISDNWLISAKNALDPFVADIYTCYISGGGFGSPVKFLTALQGIELSVTDPDAITDIIVLGGYNDITYTSDVADGYAAFKTYANTQYKNAKISVGVCGLTTNNANENALINSVVPTWRNVVNANGDRYIVKSEFVFHDYGALGLDGIHPLSAGAPLIAQIATSYILNGVVSIGDYLKLPTLTGASGVTLTSPSVTMMRSLDVVNVDISVSIADFDTPGAVSNMLIGSIDDSFARGILGMKITSPCLAIKTDDSFEYLTAIINITNGDVYVTLSDPFTTFKSIWNLLGSVTVPINLA